MTFRGSEVPELPMELSVPVSLTGSGLPRIIPSFHRMEILKRTTKGDMLIQLYLSSFILSKFILLSEKL